MGKGRLFVDLRFTASHASEIADHNGERLPMRVVSHLADLGRNQGVQRTAPSAFTDLGGELYLEYGLLDRLTLIGNWQFARGVSLANPGGDVPYHAAHVGDLELAGRITLYDDELTVALHLGVVLPTGATQTNIPIGQGDIRTDFRVLVGKVVERWRVFFAGELGLRLRGSAVVRDLNYPRFERDIDFSDEITYSFDAGYFWKIGWRRLRQILFGLRLQGKYATGRSEPDPYPNITPPSSAFLKIGPELAFYVSDRFLVHLGIRTIPVARSVPFLTDYLVGVSAFF